MAKQLKVDSRGLECRTSIDTGFPFGVGMVRISTYDGRRFIHHWHSDPEFTIIVEGEMNYQVNDRIFRLHRGQAIYVNRNALHSAWNEEGECIYSPHNFDPKIIGGDCDRRICDEYVEPIINSSNCACLVFDPEESEEQAKVISLFREMGNLHRGRPPFYELQIKSKLCEAWALMLPYAKKLMEEKGDDPGIRRASRVKKALDCINERYSEPLSLDDLASACGLSRSELCRSFKAIVKQSPMEYLSRTRIRKSLPLLTEHDLSVTQIAEKCGFSCSSYFSESFRRYMLCTPLEYVKKVRRSESKQQENKQQ